MAFVIAHFKEGVCAMKLSYFLSDLVEKPLQEVRPKFEHLGFPQCLGQFGRVPRPWPRAWAISKKKIAGGLYLCLVVKQKRGCLFGR